MSSSSTISLHDEVTPSISPGDLVVLSGQDEEEDIAFTILDKVGQIVELWSNHALHIFHDKNVLHEVQ